MAGYSGFSKSNNAVEAEANGRLPITHAARLLAKLAGLKQADAKALLLQLGTYEYHHTSKNYNVTNYYSVDGALETLAEQGNRQAYDAMVERGNIYKPGRHPSFEEMSA